MQSITIDQKRITLTIIRSSRRTIQLKILSPDEAQVRAPLTMPLEAIHRFVRSKRSWLSRHLPPSTAPLPPLPTHIILHNKEYPLLYRHADTLHLVRERSRFVLSHPPAASQTDIRTLIESYYRQYAKDLLTAKTSYWAKHIDVTYNRITIKSQKTRWGSCSAQGNLNYNYHIVCADDALIDYIVIHELCHLRHLDHSPSFWSLVAKYDPDYREHRRLLNRIGQKLMQVL